MRRQRAIALACTLALAVAGCGGGDDDGAAPGTSTTSSTTTTVATTTGEPTTTTSAVRLSQTCEHEERGVTVVVRYPEGWSVNDNPDTACSAFDPEPFELERGTEYPADLAVILRVEPVSVERASDPRTERIEDRREARIDGRRAVRLDVVSTGEALRPAGQRTIRWVIDAGDDRAVLAHTSDVEGNDFERSTEVLDEMVQALEITPAQ